MESWQSHRSSNLTRFPVGLRSDVVEVSQLIHVRMSGPLFGLLPDQVAEGEAVRLETVLPDRAG